MGRKPWLTSPSYLDGTARNNTTYTPPYLRSLFFGILFALRDGVHDVVAPGAEGRHFVEKRDVEGKPELVTQSDLLSQRRAQLSVERGRRCVMKISDARVKQAKMSHIG